MKKSFLKKKKKLKTTELPKQALRKYKDTFFFFLHTKQRVCNKREKKTEENIKNKKKEGRDSDHHK